MSKNQHVSLCFHFINLGITIDANAVRILPERPLRETKSFDSPVSENIESGICCTHGYNVCVPC